MAPARMLLPEICPKLRSWTQMDRYRGAGGVPGADPGHAPGDDRRR